jgi:hypothetical protein
MHSGVFYYLLWRFCGHTLHELMVWAFDYTLMTAQFSKQHTWRYGEV